MRVAVEVGTVGVVLAEESHCSLLNRGGMRARHRIFGAQHD